MSSGQVFGGFPVPPGQFFAVEDSLTATATGAYETFPLWKYDAATSEQMDIYCKAVGYSGGGLTIRFDWLTTTTATSTAVIGCGVRRLGQATTGFATTGFTYTFRFATDSNTATAAALQYSSVVLGTGTQVDNLAANEDFIVRLRRDATATGDLLSVSAYILQTVTISET